MRLMSIVTASVMIGATTGLSPTCASAQNCAAGGAAIPTCDYTYAPFGDSSPTGTLAQSNPWRFSSEHADDETGCVYYNYRHYEPMMGRWLSRDKFFILYPYLFSLNRSIMVYDILGNAAFRWGPPYSNEPPKNSRFDDDLEWLKQSLIALCPRIGSPVKTDFNSIQGCCTHESCLEQVQAIIDEISDAVTKASEGLWAGGWMGNFFYVFGKGRGCVEWQGIVLSAVRRALRNFPEDERCFLVC